MNNIENYYKGYYQRMGEAAYTMEKSKESSRVRQLCDWVTQVTPKGGKVLDIGCGDFYLSKALPDYKWSGLDMNTQRVPAGANVKEHDLAVQPYPFDSGTFDTIICSEVLEHLFSPEIANMEARRMIKPGGHYIVSTPNFDFVDHFLVQFRQVMFHSDKQWTREHIHFYNLESHTELLKRADFRVLDYTGADAHYSAFFAEARSVLKDLLVTQLQQPYFTDDVVDQVIGRCFRTSSHTIMMLTKAV